MNSNHNQNILALDYGDAKIGVARAGSLAKLPEPLRPLTNDQELLTNIKNLINDLEVTEVVIGLPRNMSGQETAQTMKTREFARLIEDHIPAVKVIFADESLSSKKADEYLKTHKNSNLSQDSVSACYILEEYFTMAR